MKRLVLLALSVTAILLMSVTGACSTPRQFTLTTAVEPAGAGTVSPGGSYEKDGKVRITAVPEEGCVFDCWSGDASGTLNPQTVIMDSNKTVTAHFTTPGSQPGSVNETDAEFFTVTVNVYPEGSGVIVPGSGKYRKDTRLTLTAQPNAGYSFSAWGGDISASSTSATVTVDGAKTITAYFNAGGEIAPEEGKYLFSQYVNPPGTGLVTPAGDSYEPGTPLTLSAYAKDGYAFHHWSGAISGTGWQTTIVMNSDMAVVANFEEAGTLTLETSARNAQFTYDPAYTCDGSNISPAVSWSGVPYGTRSFALIVHDTSMASGEFIHWIIYNIPGGQRNLEAQLPLTSELESGIRQGPNSNRTFGYTGPCPPAGQQHFYRFTLYALDNVIDLPAPAATKQALLTAMTGHILEESQISISYRR